MTDSVVSRATAVFSARDEGSGVVKKTSREMKDYAAAVATVNTRHDQAVKRARDAAAAQKELLKQRKQQLAVERAQIAADQKNTRITKTEADKRRAAIADELAALKAKELEITKQEARRVGRFEKMRRQSRATVDATNNERIATQKKIEIERRSYAAWSSQTNQRVAQEDKLRRAINQRVRSEVEGLRRLGGQQRSSALINRPTGFVSNAATIGAVAGGSAVLLGSARAREMQAAHAAGGVFAAGGRQRGGGRYDTSNKWRSALGAAAAGSAIFSAAAPVLGGILVGRAIRGGVSAMADYESAVVDLQKVLSETAVEQDRIVDSVTALADVLPNTREELLKMAAAGAQMGVAGRDIASFTAAMQMLISAAPSITEAEALQFGQTHGFLGKSIDFQQLAGAITQLGNTQPATEARILELIHQVSGGLGGLRQQAGYSAGDIVGIGGYAASVGARPESARTTIREWSQEWLEALSGASEKMEAFQTLTGKTEEQLREMGAADVLGHFLIGIKELGADSKKTLDVINLDGDRALAILGQMGSRTDDYVKSVKDANEEIANGGLAVVKETEKRLNTLNAAWQIFKSSWSSWTESSDPAAKFLAGVVNEWTIGDTRRDFETLRRLKQSNPEMFRSGLEVGGVNYGRRFAELQARFGVAGAPSIEDPSFVSDALSGTAGYEAGRRRISDKVVRDRDANRLEMIRRMRFIKTAHEETATAARREADAKVNLAEAEKELQKIQARYEEEDDKEKAVKLETELAAAIVARADAVKRLNEEVKKAAATAAAVRSRDYWAENAEAQARFFDDEDRLERFWHPQGGGGPPGRGRNYRAGLSRNRPAGIGLQRLHAEQDFQISELLAREEEKEQMAAAQAAYNKELSDATDFAGGFVDALGKMHSSAVFTADAGRVAFEGFADSIRDTMMIAVQDGKLSLDSLKAHFLSFAVELTTRNLFQHFVAPALGAALPGLGATPTTYTPNFAAGGNAPPGFIRVGEQGPEMLMLSAPGRVYSNSQSRAMDGGGGVHPITVNFNGPISNNDAYGRRLISSAVEGAVVAVRQIQAAEFRRGGEV